MGRRSPFLCYQGFCSKDVVLLPFVHLYSTLLPQVTGGKLKPRQKRVTGISPLRGSLRAASIKMDRQEYHDCLTGSLRDSLSSCFMDGWVPLCTLCWPSFMRGVPHRWSWRILQRRSAPVWRSVRERISVAGCDRLARCFSRCSGEEEDYPLTV